MLRIKRIIRNTSIILLLIVLSACGLDKEAKLQEEVDVLSKQAFEYYNQRNITETIATYEELLSVKSNDEWAIRRIAELKNEIKAIEGIKEFRDELYTIRKERLRSGIAVTATDLKFIVEDIKTLTNDFENLEINYTGDISTYVSNMKESVAYTFMKREINSESFENAESEDALSAIDERIGLANAITTARSRNYLNEQIDDILDEKLPDLNYE
ncbi:hypothetical protein [Paenibacillus sp. Marseille-Q4541]|uniref:hypothetical protein n=1 Tax=Paenibacillus sp. Marseille-Q4541 TaxID=2831522 RepID=UPI001BA5185F|nr:hypothetical protein [Paenibacillus sp. Marseille-Q4541]